MSKIYIVLGVVVVSLIVLVPGRIFFSQKKPDTSIDQKTENSKTDVDKKDHTQLKMFSGKEFKALYDSLSLPNTTIVIEPPAITGNKAVDGHIQVLAQQRGYELRLVAASELNTFQGQKLQVLLTEDWKDLQKAAKEDGVHLKIVSGYRSIDEQRQLFVTKFDTLGLSDAQVLSGAGDIKINALLKIVSPPGYSRHHSGYTIDIADTSTPVFAYSQGYRWISQNNFENAKKFGFIPSYPEDVLEQGPNPEPWEYVWANREFTTE